MKWLSVVPLYPALVPRVTPMVMALFSLAVAGWASVVAGEGLTKNAVEAERLIELRLRAADVHVASTQSTSPVH